MLPTTNGVWGLAGTLVEMTALPLAPLHRLPSAKITAAEMPGMLMLLRWLSMICWSAGPSSAAELVSAADTAGEAAAGPRATTARTSDTNIRRRLARRGAIERIMRPVVLAQREGASDGRTSHRRRVPGRRARGTTLGPRPPAQDHQGRGA